MTARNRYPLEGREVERKERKHEQKATWISSRSTVSVALSDTDGALPQRRAVGVSKKRVRCRARSGWERERRREEKREIRTRRMKAREKNRWGEREEKQNTREGRNFADGSRKVRHQAAAPGAEERRVCLLRRALKLLDSRRILGVPRGEIMERKVQA